MMSDMGASSSSKSGVNAWGVRSASTATKMAERVRREMRRAWCGSAMGRWLPLDREGSTGSANLTCGLAAAAAPPLSEPAPTDADRVRGRCKSSIPGVRLSEWLVPDELEGREKRFDGRRWSGRPAAVVCCSLMRWRVGVVNRGRS